MSNATSHRRRALLTVLAVLAVVATAGAAPPSTNTAPTSQPAEADSDGLGLRDDGRPGRLLGGEGPDNSAGWRLAAMTIVVLVLGAVALVVAKKFLPRLQKGGGRSVCVLETTYLGPRKTLQLVQVGSRRYLLANCKDSVRLVAEVTGSFEQAYADALAADTAADTLGGS